MRDWRSAGFGEEGCGHSSVACIYDKRRDDVARSEKLLAVLCFFLSLLFPVLGFPVCARLTRSCVPSLFSSYSTERTAYPSASRTPAF
uniref:Transmembrane protein n=1 Tax=Rhipicephalus zambeziensis TaxID=60191 RepID=A0A224Y5W7_9ACAR